MVENALSVQFGVEHRKDMLASEFTNAMKQKIQTQGLGPQVTAFIKSYQRFPDGPIPAKLVERVDRLTQVVLDMHVP